MHANRNEKGRVTGWDMTEAEYREAENDFCGLCCACGEMQYGGCEDDARGIECEECGKRAVYGMGEVLLMGGITLVDPIAEEA